MTDFNTLFDQIITELGGRDSVMALLNVGPSALSNYRKRGTIPSAKQALLDEALAQKGLKFEADDLRLSAHNSAEIRRILLIITGGIAAYKALDLARRLMERGLSVTGVMSKGAQEFITPLSVAALTGEKVYTDLFSLTDEAEMGHIRLARETDMILVAPATAHFIAKMALGMADCLASTICLATTAPVMIAPAMNPQMWAHPALQQNLNTLVQRGVEIIAPATGDTACGEVGAGRLEEPIIIAEQVSTRLRQTYQNGPLSGKHILITSGPTIEPIDPVRFIANRSSGKQGHALAAEAVKRGARVTLVSGPVTEAPPAGLTHISIETAHQMKEACEAALPADSVICAAAVADWHVVGAGTSKQKKTEAGPPVITLATNPDILASLSHHDKRPSLVIGFAAETDNLETAAREKHRRKGCDWLIANHIAADAKHSVFGADTNKVLFISSETCEEWPNLKKTDVARRIFDRMEAWFDGD